MHGITCMQMGGAGPAAASHHASRAELPHAKRKMSEMGEVGDHFSPEVAAAPVGAAGAAIEEVQECDMQQVAGQGPQQVPWALQLAESDGEGTLGGDLNRCAG